MVGRKTLVITTKDDIYKQWIEGAKKFLGLPQHEIGEIRGDKCEVLGTDVLRRHDPQPVEGRQVPGLDHQGLRPRHLRRGAIVCRPSSSPTVADMFPALLRLGLSATPERADGKELLI